MTVSPPQRMTVGLAMVGFVVALVLVVSPGIATAAEHEAVIINGDGEVVAVVAKRDEAPKAFEQAVKADPTGQNRLQYIYRSHGSIIAPPNDMLYAQQWNLPRVGVPQAWSFTDGAGVIVAVLDSGVNFKGPDGICSSIVSPYDAVTLTEGLAPPNTTAPFGHGTHVAGTIAQCTNNGIGIAGIAPGVILMPVRVLSDDGTGTSDQLARGIDWAVDHGADVINLSLGADCESTWPSCGDTVVDAAIGRAAAAGIVVVASSGNSASSFVAYPSSNPNVMSVGASDVSDSVWFVEPGVGSNRGTGLTLVAPGVDVLAETTRGGTYGFFFGTGTSMAAPHVTAAAATLLSIDPGLSPAEVRSILMNTALDIGSPGFDTASGWGRLDVGAATEWVVESLGPVAGPCTSAPCDTVAWVDAGGLWGLWDALEWSPSVSQFFFGNPGDVPFMGDWDGDGVATPGLYRQSDGFVYVKNANTVGVADTEFFFGDPGDVPLVGDFDGDGRDSVAIWRPSEARVFVINELGANGGGLGAAEFDFYFGDPGDTPFVGDFDGDGVDTVGLYRESTGFVYFRNSLSTGGADEAFFYGDAGDRILAGDWDGDGDDTVAVYRPSTGRLYVNLENTNGAADWNGFVGSYPYVITAGNR